MTCPACQGEVILCGYHVRKKQAAKEFLTALAVILRDLPPTEELGSMGGLLVSERLIEIVEEM